MGIIDRIGLALVLIGGLNWGFVGVFQLDLIAWLCGGQDSIISRILYTIVGLAAIWCISLLFRRFHSRDDHHHETTMHTS